MSITAKDTYTKIKKLSKYKITFDKRAFANNMHILKTIAINGPLLKYDIQKNTQLEYPTISRRVDSLRKEEYLAKAGTRNTKRGPKKAEVRYGLTWKGFIACLSMEEIHRVGIEVIKINPLLILPEKELLIAMAEEMWKPNDLEKFIRVIYLGYLFSDAPPLKDIKEADLQGWMLPILRTGTNLDIIKNEQLDYKTESVNLFSLLDNPKILMYVKTNMVPSISEYEKSVREAFVFFKILNDLGQFILELDDNAIPSEKIMEYLEGDFSRKVRDIERLLEDST